MTKPLEPHQLLLYAAADHMNEHGWCQNLFEHPETHAVCLWGAVRRAAGWDTDTPSYCAAGDAWAALQLSLDVPFPEHWNDKVCTSKEQAVAALRQAASLEIRRDGPQERT